MKYLSLIILLLFSCDRGEMSTIEQYLNHNDTIKYVGKEQCKMCHPEIYNSYIHTGMGKSFNYAISEHSALGQRSNIPVIYDTIKDYYYHPYFKNDSLYIIEYRLYRKDTIHKIIKKINYKIGSGHHTNSHIFEINGYLHQIPYTYYSQDDISDLPPGYENGNNSRFLREIGVECMSCHNAHVEPVEGSRNKYNAIPDGIDCESCHGPGEIHVKQKLAGEIVDTSKYIDYSIVNPSKLPLDLQFDVCQRCHLQGTSILHDSASFIDFKPGMSLNDIMDTYLPKFKDDESFIMASHVERLKQSNCFKNSEITCITCHNPHKSILKTEMSYFDNKCMNCHDLCKEEETQDCSSCHMPKSSSTDVMHVTITDHKISLPQNNNQIRGDFMGLYAINNSNPTKLSKAKAYLKRYESFEKENIYLDSALYYLNYSDNNFTSYIQYYYLKGDDKALIRFVMSSTIDTLKYRYNELALAYVRIGEVFALNNLNYEAEKYFQKGNRLMPLVIDYKLKYAVFLIANKQLKKASAILNVALSLNPTIKEIHLNLAYIDILNKEYDLSENKLKIAIALDPDYVLEYENLLLLSQLQNKVIDTKFYYNKILELEPYHKIKEL